MISFKLFFTEVRILSWPTKPGYHNFLQVFFVTNVNPKYNTWLSDQTMCSIYEFFISAPHTSNLEVFLDRLPSTVAWLSFSYSWNSPYWLINEPMYVKHLPFSEYHTFFFHGVYSLMGQGIEQFSYKKVCWKNGSTSFWGAIGDQTSPEESAKVSLRTWT